VNENAMIIEFGREGIPAVAQSPIKVSYEDEVIGEYYADILAEDRVIVEIKAARPLKSGNFCSSSRKAKISTTGIYRIFRGLKFELDTGTLVKL